MKWIGKRKRIFLLFLTAAFLLAGCGGETVHTAAQPAEAAVLAPADADTDSEAAAEAADTDKEEAAGAADTRKEETADSKDAGTVSENDAAAVEEMDETLRTELTEELLTENGLDTSVLEREIVTKGCSFTPPEAFAEAEDAEGVYVTKRYPIDASTIHCVTLEKDDAMQLLTKETFEAQTEEQFREAYGEEVDVTVDSFEQIKIDGYPAFRILCHYRVGDTEMTQLEYAINADKSYVITYSQTGEYDYMEEYEASAETIHLKF